MNATRINSADVRSMTPEQWESHFAARRIRWSGLTAIAIAQVRRLAAENGDAELERKARAAFDRRVN